MTDNLEAESAEYQAFVDKFVPKKTTDDCYTPPAVYDAISKWVQKEYSVDPRCFVRPFYPGGDYTAVDYKNKIVVDNPPFSIITQIVRFYLANSVKFFLFAPALTLFSSGKKGVCYIATGVSITYENGAVVSTSFVTNLERGGVRSAPALYNAITDSQPAKPSLPVYSYPKNVLTASCVAKMSKNGVDFKASSDEMFFVRQLDAQKAQGKTIFGSGFLLSEKLAAEKLAAEKVIEWNLSPEEYFIINNMALFQDEEQLSLIDL